MRHRGSPLWPVGMLVACLALGATAASLAADGADRAIFVDRPTLALRDLPDYAEKGRIAGALNMCPGCRVDIMHPKVGVVQSFTLELAGANFRSALLEPDSYTLRISADGWPTIAAPKIIVTAGYDTAVPIRFVERQSSDGANADPDGTPPKKQPTPPRRIASDLSSGGLADVDQAIKNDKPKGKKNDKDKGNKQGKGKGKKKKKGKKAKKKAPKRR
jgi:hypothetical protein